MCIPSNTTRNIKESIRDFIIKEGEPSALVGEFLYTQGFIFF